MELDKGVEILRALHHHEVDLDARLDVTIPTVHGSGLDAEVRVPLDDVGVVHGQELEFVGRFAREHELEFTVDAERGRYEAVLS